MQPLLSLVMVVRDEAHCIRETLESCASAVDHATALDTGSTDGTQDALLAFFEEQSSRWTGVGRLREEAFVDYARVRNLALAIEAERADPAAYSLMLSADERLHGGDALRAFLASYAGPESAFLVEVRTETDVSQQPRVIRTGSPWRYEGAVHERLVNRAEQKDVTVRIPGVYIEHRATDPERRLKRMREFDIPAMERALAGDLEEAERVRLELHLAQTHEALAASVAATNMEAYVRHLLAALGCYMLVTQRGRDHLDALNYARFRFLSAAQTLGFYSDREMLNRLLPLAAVYPNRPEVRYMIAVHAAKLDPRAGIEKAREAARVARDAAANPPMVYDPSCLWRAHLLAAHCARAIGDMQAARKSAEAGVQTGGPVEAFKEFAA